MLIKIFVLYSPMVQSLVQKRVQHLIEGGLKVLALDFDLTICSVHTRGVYMGTEEDLKRLVFYFRLLSLTCYLIL